jgi:hypothetical protein
LHQERETGTVIELKQVADEGEIEKLPFPCFCIKVFAPRSIMPFAIKQSLYSDKISIK